MKIKCEWCDGHGVVVDHDHLTNKFRGILCDKCNRALGYFMEDIEIIKSAITYLEKNK